MHRLTCVMFVAVLLLLPAVASAAIPADTDFDARAEAVLAEIATRYEGKKTFDGSHCFGFGASTMALVAQLELAERGLAGGMSLADAEDDIVHYADEAIRLAGDSSGACVWSNAGSPGTFHGFLGLAMILHRYQDRLASETVQKLETAAAGHWMDDVAPYLVNAHMGIIAARLLAGEAMGYDSALWQQGVAEFEEVYEMTTYHGGLEMNAPIYTAYQFASLMPLVELEHDELRGKARILLDYLFLVHAHLYLPGGGHGAPQSRDYAGGALDTSTSLPKIAGLWANDSAFVATRNVHLIGAVTDYRLPEVIRSIYLDKGDGYTFHAYTPAPVKSRHGRGYDLGKDGYPVAPWEVVFAPDAMFGVNHAFRFQAIHVSMGVHAKAPDGSFPALYQYQPWVAGDTSETGGGLPTTSGDDEPDDFVREGYDFRRFVHERTMISIWDPTLAHKPDGSVRTHQDTRVHIPDYSAHGGQMQTPLTDGVDTGDWYVGQVGQTYIAYYPLGTAALGPERRSQIPGASGSGTRDTEHYYLRLDGRSGGIVELATTADFADLDAYVADLKARHIAFSTGEPYYAEFDAYVPHTGGYERMRIEYEPEARSLAGQSLTTAEALDHGWLASPFIDYDADARTLILTRDCYPEMHYDLTSGAVTQEPPSSPDCQEAPGGDAGAEPVDAGMEDVGGGGEDGGDVDSSGVDSSDVGSSDAAGEADSSAPSRHNDVDMQGESSCACRSTDSGAPVHAAWLALAALLLVARRRGASETVHR